MKLSPIVLFTYKRLDTLKKTVETLSANSLAPASDLIIFSDGSKSSKSEADIAEVRRYLRTIRGFKTISIRESPKNKGLANSIIEGVTDVINQFGKVIVLEDDLITSPNFLNFMNQTLDFYEKEDKIFSVSGYTMDLPSLKGYTEDYYIGYRASSWGWGTWKNRWETVDWELSDFSLNIWNFSKQFKFMLVGSDMPYMLWKQMNKKIDSWAIRWCYHQFIHDQVTIFASKSKVMSIGFGVEATHTKKGNRFTTILDIDNQTYFSFKTNLPIDKKVINEFRQKFSIFNRLKGRL